MNPEAKPLRSMTGFARLRVGLEDGELVINAKSLNHRALDIHFHMPAELDPFENSMRAAVKKWVARGHVDVHISYARSRPAGNLTWNRPLLEAWMLGMRQAAAIYGLRTEPDLNAAFQVPGMLVEESAREIDSGLEAVLVAAVEDAMEALARFREREGAELGRIMLERNQAIAAAAERMERLRATALPAFQARLNERLGELLKGAAVEPQRLAQEAAVLADRSDIGEETARLKIHAQQLGALLAGGGEVGKKLDFLLQEMNRETNTILSKTNGIGEAGLGITDLALAVKSDIEKIREQSLNLE